MATNDTPWDAFISHATEDKSDFARPLATALAAFGAMVWYDEFTLKIGDSLSQSIDYGLANSNYGIVVLSPAFITKAWPLKELQGLVSREIGGRSQILPVWHGINYQQVSDFSPTIADKVAVKTADNSSAQIALQILSVIRPDIYSSKPHNELMGIASGTAFQELQARLDAVQEHLNEYLCPDCGADLANSSSVPLDEEQKHWGEFRSFSCGYAEIDGIQHGLCLHDPNYPIIDDFAFEAVGRSSQINGMLFFCNPRPLTKYAKMLTPPSGSGASSEAAIEDAKAQFRSRYTPD